MNIVVSEEMKAVCPEFVGACVEACVHNSTYSEELWKEIGQECNHLRSTATTTSIKENSAIAATRRIYRLCGKDPSRYRPSGEALA